MGAIGAVSGSKNDNMGTWFVNVSAEVIPGSGESVFEQDYPRAVVLDSSGNSMGSFMLSNTSGNTWSGSDMVTSEPNQVKVEAKFVTAQLEKMAPL